MPGKIKKNLEKGAGPEQEKIIRRAVRTPGKETPSIEKGFGGNQPSRSLFRALQGFSGPYKHPKDF